MENVNEVLFDKAKYNEHGELIKKCGCLATKRELSLYLREVDNAIENIERMVDYHDNEDEVYTDGYIKKLAEHIAYNEIECDCESGMRMIFTGSCCRECEKNIYTTAAKREELDLQVDLWFNEEDETIEMVKLERAPLEWDRATQQYVSPRRFINYFRVEEENGIRKIDIFDSNMDEHLHEFICYCTPPSEFNNTLENEKKFNEVDEEFVRVRRIAKENDYECDFEGLFDDEYDEDEEDEEDEYEND